MELFTFAGVIYGELVLAILVLTEILKNVKPFKNWDARITTAIVAIACSALEFIGPRDVNVLSLFLSVFIACGGYSLVVRTIKDYFAKV